MTVILSRDELISKLRSMNIKILARINRDLSIERDLSSEIKDKDPGYIGFCIYEIDGKCFIDLWIEVGPDKYEYIENYMRRSIEGYRFHHEISYLLNCEDDEVVRCLKC